MTFLLTFLVVLLSCITSIIYDWLLEAQAALNKAEQERDDEEWQTLLAKDACNKLSGRVRFLEEVIKLTPPPDKAPTDEEIEKGSW